MKSALEQYANVLRYILLLALSVTSLSVAPQNTSNNLNELLSAGTKEFLTVDEAYQLTLRETENTVIAEWVIADNYFLYGEQFHITVDGHPINFEKPDGNIAYDQFFEKDVEKHYIYIATTIDNAQFPSTDNLEIAVRYQGCADAGLCYPPETKYFELSDAGINAIATPQPPATHQKAETATSWKTLLFMLCIAIIGGMILNLMPCVFPVLSIKALSLANQRDKASRTSHGWAYTLGCILTFILMAVLLLLARNAGDAVGWGFQLQFPAVITFLALLFFIMGLSLSGVVEFGGRLMNAGQQLTEGSQKQHSFFTGALAAIVASPCTAPFMATALGYAFTQPAFISLAIFGGLGFGMALPFLLLSYLPQLHKNLPAPGAWMETFKQCLAFPLYLTSVWLLWVLGQQVGNFAVALVLVVAVTLAFLFWIKSKKPQWTPILYVSALLLLISILWHNQQQLAQQSNAKDSFWKPYSAQTLNALRTQGEPIFVNLTADWCITCKFNEKVVFTTATLQTMQDKGIHLLEGDWTNYNAEINTLLDQYGRGGVPLYLLFPAKPNAEGIILPQILNPTEFKKQINGI